VQGSFEISGLSVGSGPADVIGKSVVVHRDVDDYKSQPAGNSGPRIACGVIRKV
jgi:Cu-Zn family superoxide dismutase